MADHPLRSSLDLFRDLAKKVEDANKDVSTSPETVDELVRRLVDLTHPILTGGMIPFLARKDVRMRFIAYITRLPKDNVNTDCDGCGNRPHPLSITSKEESSHSTKMTDADPWASIIRTRDCSTLQTKRSFNVTELFVKHRGLQEYMRDDPEFVTQLFTIFDEDSDGNFFHFRKLLKYAMDTIDGVGARALLNTENVKKLFLHVHSTAISDFLIESLRGEWINDESIVDRLLEVINDSHVLRTLGQCIATSRLGCMAAADFIDRVIDELASVEMAEGLWDTMLNRDEGFLHTLSTAFEPEKDEAHLIAATNVLRRLVVKGTQTLYGSSMLMPIELTNHLTKRNAQIQQEIRGVVPNICHHLLQQAERNDGKLRHSGYATPPFGELRLGLVQILATMCDIGSSATLDVVPEKIWKALSAWFFAFPHCNIYHVAFAKMVVAAIQVLHRPSLNSLIVTSDFVGKMIQYYQGTSPRNGCHAYIILLGNMMRLSMETNKKQSQNDVLAELLKAHQEWNDFQTVLREETKRQTTRCVSTDQYDVALQCNPFQKTLMEGSVEEGIDLGSAYAACLGYGTDEGAANVLSPRSSDASPSTATSPDSSPSNPLSPRKPNPFRGLNPDVVDDLENALTHSPATVRKAKARRRKKDRENASPTSTSPETSAATPIMPSSSPPGSSPSSSLPRTDTPPPNLVPSVFSPYSPIRPSSSYSPIRPSSSLSSPSSSSSPSQSPSTTPLRPTSPYSPLASAYSPSGSPSVSPSNSSSSLVPPISLHPPPSLSSLSVSASVSPLPSATTTKGGGRPGEADEEEW